jgi:hypothetical protein
LDENINIPHQEVTLGGNKFIKISVSDLHDVTGYYTKHGNQIVVFRVYWSDRDTTELQEIISTLKFE